jgi:hypothetical protein
MTLNVFKCFLLHKPSVTLPEIGGYNSDVVGDSGLLRCDSTSPWKRLPTFERTFYFHLYSLQGSDCSWILNPWRWRKHVLLNRRETTCPEAQWHIPEDRNSHIKLSLQSHIQSTSTVSEWLHVFNRTITRRPIDFKPEGFGSFNRDISHIARQVLIMSLMFWIVHLANISILK